MKKIILLLLAMTMVFSLMACTGAGNDGTTAATTGGDSAQSGSFTVGYGQGDVTNYKNANGYSSYCSATCIAMTDAQGNTAILMSVDAVAINGYIKPVQEYAAQQYDIPAENVIVTAIHQHNTGNYGDEANVKEARKALDDAMADRAPAEMYINSVETSALVFVRHYWLNDPDRSLLTDNHNDQLRKQYAIDCHEREPDNVMQLVKFDRGEDKEPVILVNFQGHPLQGYAAKTPNGDWPVVMRETVEKKLGAKVIYVSGAGGNLSSRTRIASELSYSTDDWKAHGEKAAKYVVEAEDSYTKVETGTIKGITKVVAYKVGKELNDPNSLEPAYEINEVVKKNGEEAGHEAVKKYFPLLQSIHHAKYIVIRHELGETYDVNIGAISVGDVAFTFHSYEMFDDNGEELKYGTVGNTNYPTEEQMENPFKMTVIATCANGSNGYVPDAIGYVNGGYSTDITRYVPGTGEEMVTDYLEILNELHG